MMRLDRKCSRPFPARTRAVMPTLVATIDAPTKIASFTDACHISRITEPITNGMITPEAATTVAVPPTFMSSDAFTSRPTRNSRNIAPRSPIAVRKSLGASQPSTLGPISTPARISPTMPGCPRRSKISARIFADTKITSIDRGTFAGPLASRNNSAG